MMRAHFFPIALTLILILAAAARFIFLNSLPPLLLQDEANLGFNAISIAQTGRDEWGQRLPLTFFSFGDDKPPVYVYATALVAIVSGWSPVLPRIPSALAGVISVLLVALWTRKVFKNDVTALLAALTLAVSPWGVHLSRMALEANLALMFLLGGLTAYTYALESKKHSLKLLVLAALSLALSSYTYIAYKMVIALLLIAVAAIELLAAKPWKRGTFSLKKLAAQPSLLLLIFTGLLVLPSIFFGGNLTRYNQTALVTNESITANMSFYQGSCHLLSGNLELPPLRLLCRAVWNEHTLPLLLTTENGIQHLSPNALFFTGDTTFNRNPAATGMFFWYLLPLYLIGFAVMAHRPQLRLLVFLGWGISLLPSALTGAPHLIRMSVHLPFAILLIAAGIDWLRQRLPASAFILPLLLLGSFGIFFLKYAVGVFAESQEFHGYVQPIAQAAYREWKAGKIVYVDPNIAPEMHTYIAFWNNMDPAEYQHLVGETSTDEAGFTRPTRFGDRLIFSHPPSDNYAPGAICNPETTGLAIFSKTQLPGFSPSETYRSATEVHEFGYRYELDDMKAQEKNFTRFCGEDSEHP